MFEEFSDLKGVKVSRTGIWKNERDECILYFGIKIENDSDIEITNVKILLNRLPYGMKLKYHQVHKIPIIAPKKCVGVVFRIVPEQDFVFDDIESLITYRYTRNKFHIRDVEPFPINFQRKLFTPTRIFVKNLNRKIKASTS